MRRTPPLEDDDGRRAPCPECGRPYSSTCPVSRDGHRWVGRDHGSSHAGMICGECGIDIEDDVCPRCERQIRAACPQRRQAVRQGDMFHVEQSRD